MTTNDDQTESAERHDRLLLTVEEAAGLLGVGRTTVYQLVADGQLPAVRLRRCRRIARHDLEAFVRALRSDQGQIDVTATR